MRPWTRRWTRRPVRTPRGRTRGSRGSSSCGRLRTSRISSSRWAGPPLLSDLIYIAIIIALALGTYRVLRIFTSRLQREIDEPDLVRKRLREQRAQTVASLLNNIGLVVLSVLALLMILNTFINIGPLLAGVGVFGLAVSFGAQS